jgi:hypothetical protein
MRDKLGVLFMEEENGEIAVQLFCDPDKAKDSFDNLAGTLGQKPQRAIFLKLEYAEGKKEVSAWCKNLPVPEKPKDEMPDAWVLGKGPVRFDEEKKP